MSVKKLLILSAAGITALGATAVLAGGPEVMPVVAPPVFQPKVYVQGNIGYVYSDWRRLSITPGGVFVGRGPFTTGNLSNGSGGFTGGADLGYWFARNFAAEIGAYWLPRVRGVSNGSTNFYNTNLSINSWFYYAAGKVTVPLEWFCDNIDVYGKAGVFVRQMRYRGTVGSGNVIITTNRTRTASYCGPLWAVGADYFINENWMAKLQYMRVQGYRRAANSIRRAPSANLITVGLGYMFCV